MIKNKNGFTVVEALILVMILGGIGFVGYKVFSKHDDKQAQFNASKQNSVKFAGDLPVVWTYNNQTNKWFVQSGTAPKCKDPLKFDNSPIDISKASAVLLPGQYRGFNYKPHGGFGLVASTKGQTEVKMPMDGRIVGLTRYLESPDKALQYIVTFENDCGIAIKFDHLNTLSPRLQAVAETMPEAKLDDTRSDPNNKPKPELFKAGEVIATVVGHPNIGNYGFDFGITDYRQANEISKNSAWTALHQQFPASEWYGVCWFDMLPDADASVVKEMSLRVVNPNKPNVVSDYCKNIPKKTLDVNSGKPTDG
jgi:hypothetical protein